MTSPVPRCLAPRTLDGRVLAWLLGLALLLLAFPCATPGARASVPPASEPNYPPAPSYPNFHWLTVTAPVGGSVASTNVGGIACPESCAVPYLVGMPVSLSATPSTGYVFSGWSGDCSGNNTNCWVHMDQDRFVAAKFGRALTVVVHGPGTVTSSPSGITCGSGGTACSDTLNPGSSLTLTATPDAGEVFYSWSSGCPPGTGPCTLTMDGPTQVDAWFGADVPVQVLTVSLPSDYSPSPGMVTSTPDEVDCRNDTFFGWTGCWGIFPTNSTVTLNANPFSNSFLVDWEGDGSSCGSSPTCSIIMDTNHAVGAKFAKLSGLVVNIHKDPNFPGGAMVVGDPVNSNCTIPVGVNDQTCSWQLPLTAPKSVELTAQPDAGSVWRWRTVCEPAGNAPTCTLTLSGGVTQTVDLYFFPELVLNVGGAAGLGTLDISPPDSRGVTSCPSGQTCLVTYLAPTTVYLTAHPIGSGTTYVWGQACTGSPQTCMLTIAPGNQFGDGLTVDLNFSSKGAMNKAQQYVNSVSQNRPNPFNPETVIPYSLAVEGHVTIRIYDMAGRLLRTLVDAHQHAGPHVARWDGHAEQGHPLASGIYFYRIFYPEGTTSVRMMTILR